MKDNEKVIHNLMDDEVREFFDDCFKNFDHTSSHFVPIEEINESGDEDGNN